MRFIRNLYITNLFFYGVLFFATCFVLSFFIKAFFIVASILFWIFIGCCAWDILVLYARKNRVVIARDYPEKLSNGDAVSYTHLTLPTILRV